MGNGRIVVLVGPSSAGTTSIVDVFCELEASEGRLWHRMGIDDVLARLGWQWVDVGWPSGRGPYADLGMSVVVDGDGGGTRVDVGPLLRSLLRGHLAGVVAMADQGVDVVADEVLLDYQLLRDWHDALGARQATWVEVTCEPAEMDRREVARGDRPPGLSRAQRASCPRPPSALVIDTTSISPEDGARRLSGLLEPR